MGTWLERYFRTWLVKVDGVEQPLRRALEFVGATVEDDEDTDTLRINLPGGAAGTCTLEQFGAVGDGTTDDQGAFEAARAALAAGTYKTLILGAKAYRVAGTVDPTSKPFPFGVSVVGQGAASILKTTTNGPVFLFRDTDSADRAKSTVLANFAVEGNETGANQNAIEVGYLGADGSSNVRIENVTASKMGGRGFSWGYGQTIGSGPILKGCRALECGTGFYAYDQSNLVGCQAVACDTGIVVASGNVSWTGGDITDCDVAIDLISGGNDGHGIFTSAQVNHNTTAVRCVGTLANGHTFEGCHFYEGHFTLSGANVGSIQFNGCAIDATSYTLNGRVRFVNCRLDTGYFTTYTQGSGADVEWCGTYDIDGTIPSFVGGVMHASHEFTSDADLALTVKQSRAAVLRLLDATPTLSATRNVTSTLAPSAGHVVEVVNKTGRTLNFFWSSGDGIAIPTLKTARIAGDGTNAVCLALVDNNASTVAGGGGGGGYDPAGEVLTGFFRDFALPWVGEASDGPSLDRELTAPAGAPSAGTPLNGYAVVAFDGTKYLIDVDNDAASYLSTGAYRVILLVKPTALAAPTGAPYNDPGLVSENGGNWGVAITSDGVQCFHESGGYKIASGPGALDVDEWSLVDVIYDGANLTVYVNGVGGTPVAAGTLGTIAGGAFRIGTNFGAAVGFTGEIAEIELADTELPDASPAAVKAHVNTVFALSL